MEWDFLKIFGFYIILQLLWTFVVRWFPNILGKAIIKKIVHKNNQELEALKARYNSLDLSTNYIRSTQMELRNKVLEATEELWNNYLLVYNTFYTVVFLETILTQNELKDLFKTSSNAKLISTIQYYNDQKKFDEMIQKCIPADRNKKRLYVSDKLWLIYYSSTAFYMRLAMLAKLSLEKSEYQNWRTDSLTVQHLENILPKDNIEKIIKHGSNSFSSMQQAISYIEIEFLKEARKAISGSQAFSEALTDINSVIQLETSKVSSIKEEQNN